MTLEQNYKIITYLINKKVIAADRTTPNSSHVYEYRIYKTSTGLMCVYF